MRPRRTVRADRRRRPLRREHRGASRSVERVRPREDRARGNRPRQPLRVPPRLPGKRARPRVRLRALEPPPDRGRLAHGLCARRRRPGPSRATVAAVLVLLRLQPVQQPPRGRLGDDPARLRRRRCRRGTVEAAGSCRLQLARGCRERGLGRRQARDRRRYAPRRLSGGRLAREQVRGSALPRELRGGRSRLRRHGGPAPRGPPGREDDPERPCRGRAGLPLDHLRGPLGRAPEGVLQRPDRPQPQDPVDGTDRVVGRLAGPKLRGACWRPVRDTRDRLLLRRRRAGLARARPAPAEPACRHDLPRRLPRSCDLRHHANDLEPCCSSTRRPQAKLGADPPCLGPHVHTPRSALPRARDPLHPAWTRHLARAGGRPGRLRARRRERLGRIGRGGRPLRHCTGRVPCTLRPRAAPGRDELRPRPHRRGRADRTGRGLSPDVVEGPRALRVSLDGGGQRTRACSHRFPHPRRRLARRPVVVPRPDDHARGHSCARLAQEKRPARPSPLVPGCLPRRNRSPARASRRPLHRCAPDPRHGSAPCPHERARRDRLRARNAVRRACHHVSLFRRASAAGAARRGRS